MILLRRCRDENMIVTDGTDIADGRIVGFSITTYDICRHWRQGCGKYAVFIAFDVAYSNRTHTGVRGYTTVSLTRV